jgi:type I restriction enzyme S subunit
MYWKTQIILEDLLKKGSISLDRGRVISSIDLNKKPGNYPVYSSSAQRNGYFGEFAEYDFDEELITWSVDGGGYFFYRPKHKFSVTNVSGILRIKDLKKINYKFLYYSLAFQHSTQIYDYVDKAHPSVIKKRYLIPEIDLTEQHKIAEILTKVDNAITQTQQIIDKYERIKTGLMHDLLTKGIDAKGNIRNEITHKFKDSPLGRIPVEWECKALSKGIKHISDYRGKTPPYTDSGIPVISAETVKHGYLKKASKFVTESTYKFWLTREIPQSGDVIFTTEAPVGAIALFPENERHLLTRRVIAFNCNKKLYNKYLYYLMLLFGKNELWLKYVIGSTVPRILKPDITSHNIYYPDIDEQKLIVQVIENQKKIIDHEKLKLKKLQDQKTGLMQDLLSGKKRVNHLIEEN